MTVTINERTVAVTDSEAGELEFHVLESGDPGKPALLLLHGSGPGANASTNWEWQLGELGNDFHVIAPDIIGFGQSSHPEDPPQGLKAFTELRVRTLNALLDAMNIESATFIGNSMGGIISLAFVTTFPDRVARLVLMGGGGAPIPPSPELIKLITFYKEPTTEAMANLMTSFVADPSFFGDNLQEIAGERLPLALRPEVERSHRATFAKGEPLTFPPEVLAGITKPTLVVHGEDDKLIPIAAGEYFAEHLPNVEFDRFPNTGHWLMIEQAQPFADRVRSFMNAS